MDRNTNSSVVSTDSLLGKGHTPNYGLNDSDSSYRSRRSRSEYPDNPERWHVVALCVLSTCLASMVAGMSLSFSSIIINELNATSNTNWHIKNDGLEASLIGVS